MPKTIEEKLSEGRQYRAFDIGIKHRAEGSEEDEGMRVAGYASTFNTPYVLYQEPGYTIREQIDPGAFAECDRDDVIMQYDHMGRVFARTSNGTLTTYVDSKGLGMEADLSGTDIGRQLYQEIDGGYTTKMSFGFRVGERRREVTENEETGDTDILVTITKITKLYDVSAVSLPANDATSISARTFGEGVIAEVQEEVRALKERQRKKQIIKILTEVSK